MALLKKGSLGPLVGALQGKLIELKHLAPTYKKGKQILSNIDENFGSGTQKAVKAWQKATGRKQSGEVTLSEQIALEIATMPNEPRTKHYGLQHVNSCPTLNSPPEMHFAAEAEAFYRKAAQHWTDCPVELWDEAQLTLEMIEDANAELNAKYEHPDGTEYRILPFHIYRGKRYNEEVGSTSDRHVKCLACDGWVQLVDLETGRVIRLRADLNNAQFAETTINKLKIGGFGCGDNMVFHFDRKEKTKKIWWYTFKSWPAWKAAQTKWGKEK